MKYSIVVPYYNRSSQFVHFCKSLKHFYQGRTDYEVIVVVDSKTTIGDAERLKWIIEDHKNDINIRKYIYDNTTSLNPCRLFNYGVKKSLGEYIIITNPETAFLSDVLAGLDKGFEENPYSYQMVSCLDGRMYKNPHVYIASAWLQHGTYNNRMLHFCSAIRKKLYESVGGFDENYAKATGIEDDDFIETIRHNNIPVVIRDDITVLHQAHEISYQVDLEACKPNKEYFIKKWGYSKWSDPRANQVVGGERYGK